MYFHVTVWTTLSAANISQVGGHSILELELDDYQQKTGDWKHSTRFDRM